MEAMRGVGRTVLQHLLCSQPGSSRNLTVQECLRRSISSLIISSSWRRAGRGRKFQPCGHHVVLVTSSILRLPRDPSDLTSSGRVEEAHDG